MGLIVLAIFVLWIWAEITAFILIGDAFGGVLTFLGVFMTAVVGIWLLKRQGALVMTNLRAQMTRGEAPLGPVAESLSLLAGGVLMLIPGYVTDGLGLLMFVPGLRTLFGLFIMNHIVKNGRMQAFAQRRWHQGARGQYHYSSQTQFDDTIIEGEAEEKPIRDRKLHRKLPRQ